MPALKVRPRSAAAAAAERADRRCSLFSLAADETDQDRDSHSIESRIRTVIGQVEMGRRAPPPPPGSVAAVEEVLLTGAEWPAEPTRCRCSRGGTDAAGLGGATGGASPSDDSVPAADVLRMDVW